MTQNNVHNLSSVGAGAAQNTFDARRIRIQTFDASAFPEAVVELRKAVYGLETGWLPDSELIDANDQKGIHICLYYDDGSGERLIAATHLVDAEACDFARYSRLPEETLKQGCYSTRSIVTKPYRQRGLFAFLLYLAQREMRIKGRRYLYAYMTPGDTPGKKVIRYSDIEGAATRTVKGRDGSSYELQAIWQDVNYGMHRAFTTMPDDLKQYVREKGLFADEIERTVRARAAQFYENPWFKQIYAGELRREQYVATLSNMHVFVRWTTRLLGQVVNLSANSTLRRHYLEHLRGEIDHEVMLEHDLAHLGADVDYVMNYMVPIVEIQEFMSVQESAAAFRRDPVIFLAVPFAIEALSGFMPKEFGPALMKCIESWGIEHPRRAVSFFLSHVVTDGGDDGHWEHTRKMLQEFLVDEAQTQACLNIVSLVMNSQDRAYTAYAAIPAFSLVANAKGRRSISAA